MSWRTLLALVLIVAGLVYYALRTDRQTDQAIAEQSVALFPGLDANFVTALRIENGPRAQNVRFERDGQGGWKLTDPIVSRAYPTVPDLLVEAATRARAPRIPVEEESDLARLGLDPPRFVLTFEIERDGGTSRQRVEFGATELDGTRMFAHADGRVLLASRELEPYLDTQLHELRASDVSNIDARTVLEFARIGTIPDGRQGPQIDASFEAIQDGGAWRVVDPVVGLLDPGVMALFVRSTVNYRYETVFDEGTRPLSDLGLDPPELTLRFGTIGTEVVEIVLGRMGTSRQGRWLGTRTGSSVVWPLEDDEAEAFALPLEDLLDHRLMRARRGGIQRLEISSSRGEVRLVRGHKGWTCAIASAGSSAFGPEEVAETRVVEDVLGELERYELAGFLNGPAFDPGDAPVRWRVASEEGEFSGTFGAAYVDATGAADVLFQRTGETAVAHGDPTIVDRLARAPEEFLSLRLLEVSEVDLSGIRVRSDAGERHFERNAKGRWTRPGGEVEARELHGVLDGLLFLRASERIPESARAPLEDRIAVDLEVLGVSRYQLQFGLAQHGSERRAEVDLAGRRSVLHDPTLLEKLKALVSDSDSSSPR